MLISLLLLLSACDGDKGEASAEESDADADADTDADTDADADADTDADTTGVDADADGHASAVSGGDDCDDSDASVYPGAEETCGNGVDEDCSGADEECEDTGDPGGPCEPECASAEDAAEAILLGEEPLAGVQEVEVADLDGDGQDELIAGASIEAGGEGAIHVLAGPLSGELIVSEAAAASISIGGAGNYLGDHLSVGDLDGDGAPDIAANALELAGGSASGVALFFGPFAGAISSADAEVLDAGAAYDHVPLVVGDMDGDGESELAVGHPYEPGAGADAGAVWIFPGPIAGDLAIEDAAATLSGEVASDYAGYSVNPLGDVDGDGLADLLIGAPGAIGGAARTSAYLVLGPVSGEVSLADADARVSRAADGLMMRLSVPRPGDLDGDGLDDLAVFDLYYSGSLEQQGGVWFFSGSISGETSVDEAWGHLYGESEIEQLGRAAPVGDLDGSGTSDLALGGPGYVVGAEYEHRGAVYLAYGPFEGSRSVADGTDKWVSATEGFAELGTDLDAGDLDGDGAIEIAATAPKLEVDEVYQSAVFILPTE